MENLTYQAYLANPEIREQIDREVDRLRAEAVRRFIAAPVARMFNRLFPRAQQKSPHAIARGSVAGVNNGRGVLVRVEQGKVWITRARENTDVCLEAGESFRIDRDGLTLISALGRAPLALVTLDPPVPLAPTAAQRAADLFRKLWGGLYVTRLAQP